MSSHAPPQAHPATIGLIGGAGKMGTMLRRLFEASGHRVLVSGPGTGLGNAELVEAAEVVIVAVPVRLSLQVIGEVAPLMRPEQLLSDITSVKQEQVAAMLAAPCPVIGCHPVFGPMPDVRGQNVVLCPERPGPFLPWYRDFFKSHGMRVVELTPQAHDRSMAFVQGLTHFINIAFARTLQSQGADLEQLLQVCSPVYRVLFAMLCRILSGDPELYSQIQITNRENLPVVRDFLENGGKLLRQAEGEDWEGVYRLVEQAGAGLGDYREEARRESEFLIEQMRRYLEQEEGGGNKEG